MVAHTPAMWTLVGTGAAAVGKPTWRSVAMCCSFSTTVAATAVAVSSDLPPIANSDRWKCKTR